MSELATGAAPRSVARGVCIGLGALGLLIGSAQVAAAALLVDRGLPTDNLNNAAGVNRSNVGWDFQGFGYFAGDDFVIGGSGQYQIDKIRFWMNPSAGGAAAANNNADPGDDSVYELGDTYASMAFYFGEAGNANVPLASLANFTGADNQTDNTAFSITRVFYSDVGGLQYDYQGSSTSFIQLFQVEIDLGIVVDAGVSYQFGVECRGPNDNAQTGAYTPCFPHASNAALSGSPQDGADDQYRWFFVDDLAGPATSGGFIDSDGYGWDKSSDINIQVFGSRVPEPAALGLLGLGLAGLAAARRRKA